MLCMTLQTLRQAQPDLRRIYGLSEQPVPVGAKRKAERFTLGISIHAVGLSCLVISRDRIGPGNEVLVEHTVHAQPHLQFFKLSYVFVLRRMYMFGFCDELDVVLAWNAAVAKNLFECLKRLAVDNQQFVLVELNFLRCRGIDHGDTRTTVVHQ